MSVFEKSDFKVNVKQRFKISSDYHIKRCPSHKWRIILKTGVTFFKESYPLSFGF